MKPTSGWWSTGATRPSQGCSGYVTRLPEEFSDNPLVQRLNAQAQLQDLVEDAPSLSECESRFEQNPLDPEARYF